MLVAGVKNKYFTIIPILLFAFCSQEVYSQKESADLPYRSYDLGEVRIILDADDPDISDSLIHDFQLENAAEAASIIPGVHLVNFGSRNERSVYLRGYDIRSIPVYLDGVPMYVPYDGYQDLSRLMTAELSGIRIYKGRTPLGSGPNDLGGAINLVSRKPVKGIELRTNAAFASGNNQNAGFWIGSKQDHFYVNGHFLYRHRDSYPLSADYDSTGTVGSEDGDMRENAWSNDLNLGIKLGYAPNEKDEYSINLLHQSSSKGTPPYAGSDPGQRVRFWNWPYWEKNSLYIISKKRTGKNSLLTLRGFYDDFSNKLESFDDGNYSSQSRGYAFSSYYDDYSLGSNINLTISGPKNNTFRLSGLIRDDHHSEHNEGEPVLHFRDLTYTLGFEDAYHMNKRIDLFVLAGYSGRKGLLAQEYNYSTMMVSDLPENTSAKLNIQFGADYQPVANHILKLSLSSRSRFATMKERYSYRAGTGIPNPDLQAERANQLELSYRGSFRTNLGISANIFYALLDDAIMTILDPVNGLLQAQNTGNAQRAGFEFSTTLKLVEKLNLNVNYTYLYQENLDDPDTYFTNSPNHDLSALLKLMPFDRFSVNTLVRYMSDRYSTTYGTLAEAFWTMDMGMTYRLFEHFTIKAGINNIFDRNYVLTEGYPEPGRMFYGGMEFTL